MSTDKETWGITKVIPTSVILALMAYAVIGIFSYANLQGDVETNKERIKRDEARIEILETLVQGQAVAMARIDENIKAIRTMAELWSRDK